MQVEVQVGHQGQFLHGKVCQVLEWVAHEDGDSLSWVPETTGCGPQCYGLVDKVVIWVDDLGGLIQPK